MGSQLRRPPMSRSTNREPVIPIETKVGKGCDVCGGVERSTCVSALADGMADGVSIDGLDRAIIPRPKVGQENVWAATERHVGRPYPERRQRISTDLPDVSGRAPQRLRAGPEHHWGRSCMREGPDVLQEDSNTGAAILVRQYWCGPMVDSIEHMFPGASLRISDLDRSIWHTVSPELGDG